MSANAEQPAAVTPYQAIGGEQQVFALVDRFYDLMDEAPEYFGIRKLHPATLDGSRDKLKWFLTGWLGGPQLYLERVGQPMLRARHLPYPIASTERDQWLACMFAAMQDVGVPQALQTALRESFQGTADWMRNREG